MSRRAGRSVSRLLDRRRPAEAESVIAHDAQAYWAAGADNAWRNNSHWRDADAFQEADWLAVGREHLALFRRLARAAEAPECLGRVIDWGCGGGANAVHFAPYADELVAVDVSPASVEECRRQVASVCDTHVEGVVVTLSDPEEALVRLPGPCDLFLCLYVLELVPSQAYGLRLLDVAREALREGGLAFIQAKYSTDDPATQPHRRGYRRNLANMTTYRIDELWVAAAERGLEPLAVSLVPQNELDERYAYYLLRRAPIDASASLSE